MPPHGTGPTDHPTDDALLDALRDWLPERRWFPAKGGGAQLAAAGGFSLTDPRGAAQVRVLLVRVRSATVDAVLQVPLTLYAEPTGAPDGSDRVATVDELHVRDGAGDPAFLRAWLAAADGGDASPADLGLDADHPRVISGEQSNTSVILPGPDGGAILKVFRTLTPGENPDVDVPRRLAAQGWPNVPRPLGWLDGTWTTDDGEVAGSLGVLSQFVEGATDGFESACAMAGRGESFGRLAEELGRVVAGMHAALAAALPVEQAGEGAAPRRGSGAGELAAALEERFRWAVGSVPELATWSDAVAERLAGIRDRDDLPPRQRVHGDLHLGQALRARDQWFVMDFEGEPLSGLEARTRPDLALRDVAGMLRSFDYAAALSDAPPQWAQEARAEFLRGYATEAGAEPDADLVDLLELDKALYEAVYEARNRPQWQHIPAAALARLLDR
ncbi:maltokinase N-terminal cap-like domain-containing protein [uncultured Cellulomonas sp.]|uniref:maltokinase N-terminal cap-like domain-containing protein n=1 Tax=uncultured Cellulomonas sp. TaxID=189682 RepID=UPI00262916FE|nr:aminoglycoside phosphotransferase [uncultured Cellulomonas sp.]